MPVMSQGRCIRKFCVENCCLGQPDEVKACPSQGCELYYYRLGRKGEGATFTSLTAIKRKCQDCSGTTSTTDAVRDCWDKDCPLYPFRDGHNPNKKGKGGNHIHKTKRKS